MSLVSASFWHAAGTGTSARCKLVARARASRRSVVRVLASAQDSRSACWLLYSAAVTGLRFSGGFVDPGGSVTVRLGECSPESGYGFGVVTQVVARVPCARPSGERFDVLLLIARYALVVIWPLGPIRRLHMLRMLLNPRMTRLVNGPTS